jgi:hypothetical protein
VGRSYIDGVVQKILDIIPTGIVTGDLDEFTTGPSRLGATVREAGVCLLGIGKRAIQHLAAIGEKRIPSRQNRNLPYTLPTRSNPQRHPISRARRATYT